MSQSKQKLPASANTKSQNNKPQDNKPQDNKPHKPVDVGAYQKRGL